MQRVLNLDYLRGLAALGIMVYHYSVWTFGKFNAETILGRIGIYGVSIFYVLSGVTLFYVYAEKMRPSARDLADFYLKRILRIFPLLWLATLLTLVFVGTAPDYVKLFLNLTGLFSIVQWDGHIAAGAWSIGNELVFYLFFPVFVLLLKRNKIALFFFSLIIAGVYFYFSFVRFDPTLALNAQKSDYFNPLNQVFLFLGGFLIGYFSKRFFLSKLGCYALLTVAIATFVFYPAAGDRIHLLAGTTRIVFTFICFAVCWCACQLQLQLPEFLERSLSLLGECSYSVYLLHPVVYSFFDIINNNYFHGPESVKLLFAIGVTFPLSYFVYHYFEKFFISKARLVLKLQKTAG